MKIKALLFQLMTSSFAGLMVAMAISSPSRAQSCDVRSSGVAGTSLGDYNPLSGRALSRDMTLVLTGPAGSRAWVRVQTPPAAFAKDQVNIEYLGLANAGLARIDGPSSEILSSDVGTLNASWLPVFFDAQGQGLARIIAHVPEAAYAQAGMQTQTVNLAVACEQDGIVRIDSFPVTAASLSLRIVSAIRVSDTTSNVLRFGVIPETNPDGYSPTTAHTTLSVASTGGFDVRLSSADWTMRGVNDVGVIGRDTIPFRAIITSSATRSQAGAGLALRCDASLDALAQHSFEVRAQLPASIVAI
jgi:hypothetical protein